MGLLKSLLLKPIFPFLLNCPKKWTVVSGLQNGVATSVTRFFADSCRRWLALLQAISIPSIAKISSMMLLPDECPVRFKIGVNKGSDNGQAQ
jgi:hypothetical protein